jgi:hypothetical protein
VRVVIRDGFKSADGQRLTPKEKVLKHWLKKKKRR